MRGLILLAAAVVFSFAVSASAQQPAALDHPGICPPLDREWRAVAGGTDLAAMDRVIARIPGACPNLRAEARRTRVQAARLSSPQTPPQREPAVTPAPVNPCDVAEQNWATLRNSTDIARLQRFVRDTPASCGARGLAQARITTLQRPPAPSPQAQSIPLPEMVRIAGQNFEVGRYEVTFAQWDACVAAGGCDDSGARAAGGDNGWGRGNRPVIEVSWDDAQSYVRWLRQRTGQRYRFLTSTEWDIAARAGTTTNFSWGDQDPVCDQNARNGANFSACTDDRTRPVGSFQPNAFGLYDMHGNVREWVEDCYDTSCSSRVLRGGSWYNPPEYLRSANRIGNTPTYRINYSGFRVARTV